MSAETPAAFHVMAKPAGASCNLECKYCFYLDKKDLYPGSELRMSDETMESYVRQTIEARRSPLVTIAWQGGEPTLMGLDFFKRSIAVEKRYLERGMAIENTLQTNGVLLDEEWCSFLREDEFLVGLSLDGPQQMHDAYRRDKAGRSVFKMVVRAAELMRRHDVQFNVLCTVNAVNSRHPLEVYQFFRDELGVRYIQFIPIVERRNESGNQERIRVTDRSVRPGQYGRFLIEIFDEWVRRDVGDVFVQLFDGTLASWVYGRSTLCIFQPTCGEAVVMEHNGDLYSCDHFVEPGHLLGNIRRRPLVELAASDKQSAFGKAKCSTLPRCCRECEVLFACYGECPKNRVLTSPDGEPGLNWLCTGLKAFFKHVDHPMKIMADLLMRGRTAPDVMQILAVEDARTRSSPNHVRRNDPCPCGSGLKFKRCHGK